jgi:diaminopimelate epimerase
VKFIILSDRLFNSPCYKHHELMKLNFTKMHGLGNDFIVINNLNKVFNENSINIPKLANRHTGIGFDQLLIVESSETPDIDFRYRIFNADGQEVQQCGNGARCFALYVFEKKLTSKRKLNVETLNGILELIINDASSVSVNMGKPEFVPSKIPANLDNQHKKYSINDTEMGVLSMGNPHAVILADNIENIEIDKIAKDIQNSGYFPESVNVGFMQINSDSNISLRVFERGVGETQACGTGACAAVVFGVENDLLDNKVCVSLPGGNLEISYEKGSDVLMTGPAQFVFEGSVDI